MPTIINLKKTLSALPNSPGVYQYLNKEGTIIYVGKAKNLKKRVSSYFNKKDNRPARLNILIRNIDRIEYIVVDSESDALLLENNLIKKHQPRYNVLLKDGKTYPWLCITKEEYPRVFKTRQILKGGLYFGPYSSIWTLDVLLQLIREIYPIRTCKHALNKQNIKEKKYKVCLEYHLKNCGGVCEGLQSKNEYTNYIDEIKEIAKGNSHVITNYLLDEINKLANSYQFEEADKLKKKYTALKAYQKKTVITSVQDIDLEVFGYDEDDKSAYINILKISKGSIVQAYTIEYQKRLEEPKEELLAMAIVELRSKLQTKSKTIYLQFSPNLNLENTEFIVPKKGNKKKLLDLSIHNAKQYRLDKLKRAEKLGAEQGNTLILKELQTKLKLETLPIYIESFDNSHISGSDAVASCIVYKKGKPVKKEYRNFLIKWSEGNDDYASMREVVYRRYKRKSENNETLPDLIIADGGIGQMNAIREITHDKLKLNIPIAGLSKNSKHKTNELLFGFPPKIIGLKPTDSLFRFLAQIQEEVHRSAITFHRKKRSQTQIASELDTIPNIGEKTKTKLLSHFKSVKRIKEAEKEDLEKIIIKSRASAIYDYFNIKRTSAE